MKHFDANAMIGAHFAPREGRVWSADDLVAEMDFYGIDDALVYHGLAAEYDLDYGNRQLLDALRGRPRLHPCMVVAVPPHGPAPAFESMLRDAIRAGVKAVRFFWGGPLPLLTVLDLDTLGDLFTTLERHRLPMVLTNNAGTEISGDQIVQVKNVCKAFPALPVILSSPKLSRDFQIIYTLLDRCRNFHLDTSSIHGNGLLEEIARRFGVHHLIFGTNFPWCGGGQSKIALAYADLPTPEKEAVASGNLTRLLEAVQ